MTIAQRIYRRENIEAALRRAYASLEGRPCMARGSRLVEGHAPPDALPLNWVQDFVPDRAEQVAVLTFARVQAKAESWSELCRDMGWNKHTVDRRRLRAIRRILAGLNAARAVASSCEVTVIAISEGMLPTCAGAEIEV